MKRGFTNYWLLILFLSVGMQLWAQAPDGYYSRAEKKSSAALKSELFNIISNHKVVSYNGLWTVYRTSDIRPDGTVWDMYSTVAFRFGSGQCGSYKLVGDCYNREHSFPQSWFSKASPMVSDAFHIYPTDGKVNGQRSNFAYGETANGTQVAASSKGKPLGKLGPCSFPDCSGTVFEPVDEYKGDFARTYFYMATRYQDRIKGWNSPMLGGDDYKPWAINLLLKWHRQDPISKKETDRNNAVYEFQHNRNPFIDYPELVEYIWGNNKGQDWIPGGATTPMLIVPVNNTSIDMGVTAVHKQLTTQVQVKGQGLTENLIVNVNGIGFSTDVQTLNFEEVNRGTTLSVSFLSANAVNAEASLTLSNGQVSSTIQLTAQAIDGIPALPAENVSLTSFTACWMDVDKSGNYMLNVMNADGSSLVGYPVLVATTAQKHEVSGLQSNTTYQYQLSKGDKTSNKITVITATPIPVLELISPAGGLIFGTKPGEASEIKEVEAYTENITEDIKATISAPFEISLNKEDWVRELTLDRKGESFYVRISATASAGMHTGTLSLSTATIDGDEVDVTGTVALPRVFFETFEAGEIDGYYNKSVACTATTWKMNNVGIWGSTSDRHNETRAARFKNPTSSITMEEDKIGGVSSLSFYAALFGRDADATIEVSYSINQGTNWVVLGTNNITSTTLQQINYNINVPQPVRIKIEQKSGRRINIDDIAMSDYHATGIATTEVSTWDAYSRQGKLVLEMSEAEFVKVYSANAVEMYQQKVPQGIAEVSLPKGMYIVVCGEQSKKVIIK